MSEGKVMVVSHDVKTGNQRARSGVPEGSSRSLRSLLERFGPSRFDLSRLPRFSTKTVSPTDGDNDALPGVSSTLALDTASTFGVAPLVGFVAACMEQALLEEAERSGAYTGVDALTRAAVRRLGADDPTNPQFRYTRRHSFEVAMLALVMRLSAERLVTHPVHKEVPGVPGLSSIDPVHVIAGGITHDVGKTLIPSSLLARELGAAIRGFKVIDGRRLADPEVRVLQDMHIAGTTRYGRIFLRTNDPAIGVVTSIGGLHHVTFDGDHMGRPRSYPAGLVGAQLPFLVQCMPVADLLSALQPRHYRDSPDNTITTLDAAVSFSMTTAGTQISPLALACLLHGVYGIELSQAEEMIRRFGSEYADARTSSNGIVNPRKFAKEHIERDDTFVEMVHCRNSDILDRCRLLLDQFAETFEVWFPPKLWRNLIGTGGDSRLN